MPLDRRGGRLKASQKLVKDHHYTRSIPSGKSHWFEWGGAVLCFSIPANKNIGRFLLKRDCVCWELARLWAPNGHARNLLTEIISKSVRGLKTVEPDAEVLVSYADPNVGHEGHVYRAASWVYTGMSDESRGYVDTAGAFYPRRKFHSGGRGMTKAEIEAQGFKEIRRVGKHRFAKGLTAKTRREIGKIWQVAEIQTGG